MANKILLLDDEQDFILSLQNFLRQMGYAVESTLFPKHALEIISKDKPDLVLFDFKLPDMDGDVFLKKAKEISGDTKYILITAYRDDAIANKFKKLGAEDVILKPIDLEKLLEKIKEVLK